MLGNELIEHVMKIVQKYATDSMTIACIEKELTEEYHDKLLSSWCYDDVRSLKRKGERTYTDVFCQDVLEYVRNKHDSEIGINWQSIRYAIDEVLESD